MSKVKLLNLLVVLALMMSFLFSGSAPLTKALPLDKEIDPVTNLSQATPREPAKATAVFPVLDDFESGLPQNNGSATPPNGWIPYTGGGSVIDTAAISSSLPGQTINTAAAITYTITGGGWGGVSRSLAVSQDWSTLDGISFWLYGSNSGHTVEIQIFDNRSNPNVDTSERFVAPTILDNFTGWKHFILPWSVFTRNTGYQPDGAPNDGLTLTQMWGYNIAFASNTTGTVYVDNVKIVKFNTLDDFESGLPQNNGSATPPNGWIPYTGGGSVIDTAAISSSLPGQTINTAAAITYTITGGGWGGVSRSLAVSQDWSTLDGISFWLYGSNSGHTVEIQIFDNRSNPNVDTSERFVAPTILDNFTGWKYVSLPWSVFTRNTGYQPDGAPNDGLTLTQMWGYNIAFASNTMGTVYVDNVAVFGGQAQAPVVRVEFSDTSYTVNENVGSALIPVQLNITSTSTISVSYTTTSGTATPDVDYTPVSGELIFVPGTQLMTITVPITDDMAYELGETIGLSLTDAISATIGFHNPATLNILDNDAPPDILVIDNFEGGLTTGRDIFNNPIGYSTWGSTPNNVVITVTGGMTVPGGTLPNNVLKMTSNIENWGGFTDAFKDDQSWGHQDWSRYDGMRFWFYGTNSGKPIQIEIFDNRQLENPGDSAERWYQRFTDNFSGWQQISLPFAFFQRREPQPVGTPPNDGLNLTEVSGYAFNMPSAASTTIYYVDQVELYGDLSAHPATTRVNFSAYGYGAIEGQPLTAKLALNTVAAAPITVTYTLTTSTASHDFDFTGPLSGTVVFAAGEVTKTITVPTIDDHKVEARETITLSIGSVSGAPLGYVSRTLLVIFDNDTPDPKLIDDFENGVPAALKPYGNITVTTESVLSTDPLALPGQDPQNNILHVTYNLPASTVGGFDRKFDAPKDLSQADGVSFWFNGTGSGQVVTVTLLDNGQPDPGPTNWTLAWSDEFSGTAGAAPNPANWGYDIGGGGWGNSEWEYYTDSRDNSALDGNGHLVISAITNTNPAYTCASSSPTGPGGPCYATSARLLSAGKQEFTHGRVEARLKIPKGQGIWPAFWMLGNDIFTTNPWPASGEIDIMENIGKLGEQTKVYGTLHGPGYSGGSGIGRSYDVTPTVLADDFHVYAIEWEPTMIRWYLDGYNYFTATNTLIPAGTNWVFNHPFFIIMNVAVGGGWPGYPDATTQLTQTMTVDYVRVYQAPDTAERFETTFVDNISGWRKVTLPFSAFKRSAVQPVNAPNDGLTLTAAQGYRFDLRNSSASQAAIGGFYLDDVRQVDLVKLYLPLIRR